MLNPENIKGKIICIYGPTASSKSKLAIMLAQKIGGVIINADSMQVYKDVPILTSQPSNQEINIVKHKLYSIISLVTHFSVGEWIRLAVKQINDAKKQGLYPILVGGTGLYFSKLIKGIAQIPEIKNVTKDKVKNLVKENNNDTYSVLVKYDAKLAEKLQPKDKNRILRGLEVIIQTGKSILEWQKDNTVFFNREDFFNIYLCPLRDIVYENINQRFIRMLDQGVENEVKNILAKYNNQKIPKVIGLNTIKDYILSQKDRQTMISDVQKLNRHYAKRQYTWFNNQLDHDLCISTPFLYYR